MRFFEEFWQFICTFICAPTRPVTESLEWHPRHSASKDIRIIHCLSPATYNVLSGNVLPKCYIGVISSDFPKTTMIPCCTAYELGGFAFVSSLGLRPISLSGFENMQFYPFRELAYSLGYDILWCSFKDEGSKLYSGHVLFAEHVSNGVWVRVSELNLDAYRGDCYTGGWAYATYKESSYYYVVKVVGKGSFYIPKDDVLEVVKP